MLKKLIKIIAPCAIVAAAFACGFNHIVLFTKDTLYVYEDRYVEKYEQAVEPFVKQMRTGQFTGARGVSISYQYYEDPANTQSIIILPGYSESSILYQELIYDFAANGYNVFVADHRGMGLSGREVENPHICHVEEFEDYLVDWSIILEQILPESFRENLYMFAHSTGGLIGLHLLENFQDRFKAVVFSSPLFRLRFSKLVPGWMILHFARLKHFLWQKEAYGPFSRDLDPEYIRPEHSSISHSLARNEIRIKLWKTFPKVLCGGPSINWLIEVITATRRVPEIVPKINRPVLILQSEFDYFVDALAHDEAVKSNDLFTKRFMALSYHEPLREVARIRDRALDYVLGFYRTYRR